MEVARLLVGLGADPDAQDDRQDSAGSSPVSPGASPCSRHSCRRTRTSPCATGSAAYR
ncbi:hypothetical protein [Kribbella sp. DT2]|uniref:hypothetical protein n=1 Tax=Kribbella sp. DT2 TaxID=3393427 RepID=UPI003CEEB73C